MSNIILFSTMSVMMLIIIIVAIILYKRGSKTKLQKEKLYFELLFSSLVLIVCILKLLTNSTETFGILPLLIAASFSENYFNKKTNEEESKEEAKQLKEEAV